MKRFITPLTELPEVSVTPVKTATARALAIMGSTGNQLAVGLAAALTRQQQAVCLIDAPAVQTRTADGPGPLLQTGRFAEHLERDPDGIWRTPPMEGLAAFRQLTPERQEWLLSVLRYLESRFDYLVIDTGAAAGDRLTELRLAVPHSVFSVTPEEGSVDVAFSLLERLQQRGFGRTLHLLVEQAPSLVSGYEACNRFRLQVEAAGMAVHCAGILLNRGQGDATPLSAQTIDHCLDVASSRLLQTLADENREERGIAGFFERQRTGHQQPGTSAAAPDPETAGLIAAAYHAALITRR